MARINNLTNFLTDIATAIKSKTGRNTNITPSNFDTEILSIASDLTTKTITSNGTYNASSDNVDGYSSVTVNVPSSLPTITDAEYLCAYGRVNLYDTLLAMCSGITSVAHMFYYANNVANLDLTKLNVFNITNMADMFSNAKFTSLNFNGFNTSNVTNMSYMFYYCRELTSLDLSSFNTSNVTDMSYMFNYCSKLASLNLSSFNTSNVIDMSYMFSSTKFTSLNLSSFNTSNVTDMSYMFYYCREFTSLNLSSFNTSNVTDMSYMFNYCSKLASLNLSSFNTSNVTDMSWMFRYANKLATLDISNFDFSGVTSYGGIFTNCGTNNATPTTVYVKDATAQQWILNLSSGDRPSNWSTSNVVIKGS